MLAAALRDKMDRLENHEWAWLPMYPLAAARIDKETEREILTAALRANHLANFASNIAREPFIVAMQRTTWPSFTRFEYTPRDKYLRWAAFIDSGNSESYVMAGRLRTASLATEYDKNIESRYDAQRGDFDSAGMIPADST